MTEQTGLWPALVAAWGEIPQINKTDRVETGSYAFTYAPLDVILSAVRPVLAKHNLAAFQTIKDGCVVTVIVHISGEQVELAPVKIESQKPGPQAYGSAVSYAGRYSLCRALLIATGEDDDANTAEGNKAKIAPKEKPAPKAPAPKAPAPPAETNPPPALDKATEKQLAMVYAMAGEAMLDPSAMKLLLKDKWGRASTKELSKTEASQLIDYLKEEIERKREHAKPGHPPDGDGHPPTDEGMPRDYDGTAGW